MTCMMDRVRTFCLETGHQRFRLRLYDDLSYTLCFFVVFFVNIFVVDVYVNV
jgi:hypothetical protein